MRRILFEVGGVRVYAYPAMLSVGVVLGTVVANHVAHLAGANALHVYLATLLLLGPALVGARLLHVASQWRVYRRDRARVWRRLDGGASLYGGLLVALLLSPPILWLLALPFWMFWDIATYALLVGMMFTKIGCLLNGCCAGRPIAGFPGLPLADHQDVRTRRIPSQILEAGWALLLLGGISVVRTYAPPAGTLFLVAVAGYGGGRLLLESTRDTIERIGGLSLHRVISIALAVLALGGLVARWLGGTGPD